MRKILAAILILVAASQCGFAGTKPKSRVGFRGRRVVPTVGKSSYTVRSNIPYAIAGKVKLLLDAYLPTGDGPFPGVLVVHGGAWMSGGKTQLAPYAIGLAANGFATFAISYRLAPRYKFPAQIEDCRSAVRWIRKHSAEYHVDPQRLGGVGYSAGGHLVALLGVTGKKGDPKKGIIDTRLQAVAAGGAPCDFRLLPLRSRLLAFWLGGTRQQFPQRYRTASPAAFVTSAAPPMFFFSGERDRVVPPLSPQLMVKALKSAHVEAEIYIVPNAAHVATTFNREALLRGMMFLNKHLKRKSQSDGR